MKSYRFIIPLFIYLITTLPLIADLRYAPIPHIRHLPEVSTLCFLQDSEGYMWYGMNEGGLCRDNGYQIDQFRNDRHHPNLLGKSNTVLTLVEDRRGNIVIGTKAGCYVLDKSDYSITPLDPTLQDNAIHSICARRDGSIWLTANGMVYVYDNQYRVIARHKVRNMEGKESTNSFVYEDNQARLWVITTPMGLARLNSDGKTFTPYAWQYDYPPSCMVEDPAHHCFWIGTYGGGIVKYEVRDGKGTVAASSMLDAQRTHTIQVVLDQQRGYLWQVTTGNIFAYRTADNLLPVTLGYDGEFDYKIVNGLCLDHQNNVWVAGTNPQSYNLLSGQQRLQFNSLAGISEDRQIPIITQHYVSDGDEAWIQNDRIGLCHLDASGGVCYANDAHYNQLGNLKPTFIPCRRGGGLWGHTNSKLFHIFYADGEIKSECVADNDNRINRIVDDKHGHIYMGDAHGISRYDVEKGISARLTDEDGPVECMAADKQGNLYYCTTKYTLLRYTRDGKREQLMHDGVFRTITIDDEGRIWLGNSLGEVGVYDVRQNTYTVDEMASNSSGNGILTITTDAQGCLCILTRCDCKLYDVSHQECTVLGSHSQRFGLQYFLSATFDGCQHVLTGAGGYLKFTSQDINQGAQQTWCPTISSYLLDGEKHYTNKDVTDVDIESDVKTITLYFTSFDMLHADEVVFSYRVNKGNWVTLSQGNNEVVLQDLHKGDYAIEVRATDANGVLMKQTSMLMLHRLPAWWDTWWAYLLYVLAVVSVVMRVMYTQHQKAKMNLQIRNLIDKLNEAERQREDAVAISSSLNHDTDKTKDADGIADTPSEKETESIADTEFLQKAMQLVEANMDNTEYDVEQFSSDMCMSRATLYRKMIAITGQKPTEFIRIIRLKRAAQLLKGGRMSVSEVVDSVGFSSTSYFNKRFKELFGVQPSLYK